MAKGSSSNSYREYLYQECKTPGPHVEICVQSIAGTLHCGGEWMGCSGKTNKSGFGTLHAFKT